MTTEEKVDYSHIPPAVGCSNDGDPIIQVRNIRKWYQANKAIPFIGKIDWLKAVDDVSFDVLLVRPLVWLENLDVVKQRPLKWC